MLAKANQYLDQHDIQQAMQWYLTATVSFSNLGQVHIQTEIIKDGTNVSSAVIDDYMKH